MSYRNLSFGSLYVNYEERGPLRKVFKLRTLEDGTSDSMENLINEVVFVYKFSNLLQGHSSSLSL